MTNSPLSLRADTADTDYGFSSPSAASVPAWHVLPSLAPAFSWSLPVAFPPFVLETRSLHTSASTCGKRQEDVKGGQACERIWSLGFLGYTVYMYVFEHE